MNISQEAGTAQPEGEMNDKLVEAVASAIYDSHRFVKSWDHPDTVRIWHDTVRTSAKAAIQAAGVGSLLEALVGLTDHYAQLVNCGDCGNWDPEKEPQVIAARAAIAKALGDE